MKKLTCVILSLLVLQLVFVLPVSAAEKVEINGLIFSVNGDSTADLIGTNSDENVLVIPSEISGVTSITIKSDAFKSKQNLEQVVLSELVTKIESKAFSSCKNLKILNIAGNVKELEENFVYKCGLEYLVIDEEFDCLLFENKLNTEKQIKVITGFDDEKEYLLGLYGYKIEPNINSIRETSAAIVYKRYEDKILGKNISVNLDGNFLDFDVLPTIIDGRTMLPIRIIFEALDATVDWDDNLKKAKIVKGDSSLEFSINNKTMKKNGGSIALDVAPQIIEGRTLVPVRAISEALNCRVEWDDVSKIVAIDSTSKASDVAFNDKSIYSSEGIEVYPNIDKDNSSVEKYLNMYFKDNYYIFSKTEVGSIEDPANAGKLSPFYVLKKDENYVGIQKYKFGTLIISWTMDDFNAFLASNNILALYSSGLVDEQASKKDKKNDNSNSNYEYGSSSGGKSSKDNVDDVVDKMVKAEIQNKISQIENQIKRLNELKQSIMKERNKRIYTNGGWGYTYDQQAAQEVQEQIDKLEEDLKFYKSKL